MNKILIGLFCIIFCLACSKDDDKTPNQINDKEKEKVFNALLGKWQFTRIAMDSDFTKLTSIKEPQSKDGSYLQFNLDSTYIDAVPYFHRLITGKFEITSEKDGDIEYSYIRFENGACVIPSCEYRGGKLYSYTDSTLIFRERYNMFQHTDSDEFIEFKRIK